MGEGSGGVGNVDAESQSCPIGLVIGDCEGNGICIYDVAVGVFGQVDPMVVEGGFLALLVDP